MTRTTSVKKLPLIVSLYLLVGFCVICLSQTPREIDRTENKRKEENASFKKDLLKVAKEYKKYGRVDDQARWAPTDCQFPAPSVGRLSQSKDSKTHGRKIYFLFAKQRYAYIDLTRKKTASAKRKIVKELRELTDSKTVSPGQVIVKEAWKPKEIDKTKVPTFQKGFKEDLLEESKSKFGGRYFPYAHQDGKYFAAEKKAGLFIMIKYDPKTPGTDRGWIYGLVDAEGKKVKAVGKLESCMKCHRMAKHDRLFGLNEKTEFSTSALEWSPFLKK